MQSLSDAQPVRQAVPAGLHRKAPHEEGAGGAQRPAPLQVRAGVNVVPAQTGAAHVTSAAGKVQRSGNVLQVPAQGVVPPHAPRPGWGVPLTWEQVPTSDDTSQAMHCPGQASLQQTRSTQ